MLDEIDEPSAVAVLLAALTQGVEDLASAVRSQSEVLESVGGDDKRISGDSVLFRRVSPLRSRVSVVIKPDLFSELVTAGHPATEHATKGTRTLCDVLIEDEGRGWLRIYECSSALSSHSSWDLMVPLSSVEAVVSPHELAGDSAAVAAGDGQGI